MQPTGSSKYRVGEASLRFYDSIPFKANTIKVGKECARLPITSFKDLVQSRTTAAQILGMTTPEIVRPENHCVWDLQLSERLAQCQKSL